ncbi:hypothetical protein UJ101_02546 [Flavobacteriaceae bacterium UJ101]|nr:hypothetical protein UJ101_02546 [Flavobacteriaceae bacterium UJ101]
MNFKIKRGLSFGIDLMIIALLIIIIEFIIEFNDDYFYYMMYGCLFLKDVLSKKGSLGKLILGLKLETNNNQYRYFRIISRNFSLVLWPIEAIVFTIYGKRIGDYIFKTDVVLDNKINDSI